MVTVQEVANYFTVCSMTIYKAIKDGKIKAVKLGGSWRISKEEFERLKEEGYSY